MIVLENEHQIIDLKPDFPALRKVDPGGIIVTSPGSESDYVYRFFAPFAGIDEDPVTGSANCILIPYWSKRLNKKSLYARQLSERSGEIWGRLSGNRALISGFAVTYMQGNINITIKQSDVLIPFGSK